MANAIFSWRILSHAALPSAGYSHLAWPGQLTSAAGYLRLAKLAFNGRNGGYYSQRLASWLAS